MKRSADTLDQLKADLVDQAEPLLLELFGQPRRPNSREWRWGSKGGLAYRFDRGQFFAFEQGPEARSLLDAFMYRDGCSFPEAMKRAREWLGTDEKQSKSIKRPPPQPRPKFDADADQERARAEALALWRAGRSIAGTAAARYLQSRAIEGWPADAVRMIAARDVARIATGTPDKGNVRKRWTWWRWPALMFPMTNAAGTVTAVQLVAITDQGEAVRHWERLGKLKMLCGERQGAAFRMSGDEDGPLVLTEGGETGLSPWLATGLETWAILGPIGSAPLDAVPLSRTIIVARDDDPPRSPARKALRDRITAWRTAGRHVVEAQPWPLSRGDKSDFNDTLQQDGPDAVRERIEAALRPPEPPPTTGRVVAEMQLARAVGRTVEELLTWQSDGETPPPFKVGRATLGLGKSRAAIDAAIDAIGDKLVDSLAAGHRIVYAAPTHDLCGEIAERAREQATKRGREVTVRVWHGRDREDPAAPGQRMCRDVAAAELAQQAGIDVLKTVCNAPCQFRDGCAYLAQREAEADLWVVPHALLFVGRPPPMAGASLLIIDEQFALSGIMGADSPLLVTFKELADQVAHGNGKAEASADLEAELRPLRSQLLEALADHPALPLDRGKNGHFLDTMPGAPLQRTALVAAGLTVESAELARKAEGRRRRDVPSIAAPTRADLLHELSIIMSTNTAAKHAAMLWDHLANMLADDGPAESGRVELVELEGNARAFRLFGLAMMGQGWRELPTLHLDATADMDLIRLRVPGADLVANIQAAEPHVAVHQIVGRTFGKGAMHGDAGDDARRFALATAAEHGGRWLVVASKNATDEWRPTLPPNVEAAHWGNVRGLDGYGDVRGLVVVGRWGVPPDAVGRIAGIMTGRAVPRINPDGMKQNGGYRTEAITLTAADGSARTVDAERHPHPIAEAVRRAVVDAELLQAIGRGRGVRRSAGDPLAVYVLGNVPLPVPLATLADWQPVDADRAMLADHGAVLASDDDAAIVIGKGRNAIKCARRRLGSRPYKKILYGHDPNLPEGLASADYQRSGAGRSESRMIYDPSCIPDPRAWLEAHLGPLAHFDGADLPTDRPPARSRPAPGKPAPAPAIAPMGEAAPPVEADKTEADPFFTQYARARDGLAAMSPADPGMLGNVGATANQAGGFAEQYAPARGDLAGDGIRAPDPVKNGLPQIGGTSADAGTANFAPIRARDQGEAGPMAGHGARFMVPPIAGPDFLQSLKGEKPAEFSGAVKGADQPHRNLTKPNIRPPLADLTKPHIWPALADLKKPEVRTDLAAHPFWTTGGTMPAELVAFARIAWRASGLSQQALADRAALSRPQLANGLQGRFGLSPAAAGRLLEALTALPDRAPDLFDLPQHEASP